MSIFLSTMLASVALAMAMPFIIGYMFCRNGNPKWEIFTRKSTLFLGES